MTTTSEIIGRVFRAIEERNLAGLLALQHPDIEFHWPPCLPYGGVSRGATDEVQREPTKSWIGTWAPLQPTEAERQMDPRIVAASDSEVVVLWHQRAIDGAGRRLDELVLGMYEIQDDKLARAQMFYFDPVAVSEYLANVAVRPT
jgi:ketosteroid isomerase-like protein